MQSSTKWAAIALFGSGLCGNYTEALYSTVSNVVWAESTKSKVVHRFDETLVKIDLVNPCDLLATLYPKKLEYEAREKCNVIYSNLISEQISKWCPEKKRKERFIVTLLVIGVVLALGTGVGATLWAHSNSNKIDELAENQAGQNQMMTDMEEQIETLNYQMGNLTEKHNSLVSKVMLLAEMFEEVHGKLVDVTMQTALVISQLSVKKVQIREATRLWNDSILHPEFFDIFDFKLPCGDYCPLELIKPISCEYNGDNELSFRLLTPFVDEKLVIMQSFPFDLLEIQGSKTCVKKYIGPKTLVLSKTEKCVVDTTDISTNDEDFVTIVSNFTCVESIDDADIYNITDCVETNQADFAKFVQVKIVEHQMLVYCPKSVYKVNNITSSCDDRVMVFSSLQPLQINGLDIITNKINLTITHKINVELADVAGHVVKTLNLNISGTYAPPPPPFTRREISEYIKHPLAIYGGTSIFSLLAICIVIFVCYKYFSEKKTSQPFVI